MLSHPIDEIKSNHKSIKEKAAEIIYQTLKEEILLGKIAAGTLLSETDIADRFNVSRTPVREALGRLTCDRVIHALPQRGHLVRTVSLSEILEAFRVREILEVEAAGEAARRITDDQVAALKTILLEEENPFLANYKVHTAIARISGNRLLADFIDEVLILMQRLIVNHPDVMDPQPEIEVIEALETRDVKAARETMRFHIRDVRNKLLGSGNGVDLPSG
ncbi:MAG: GntR family transcriptional regulator [Anaerolineaceae bacterium]|nr:GntR family transcriptional regulator [Anaerolineaceae bacterium]